MAPHDSRGGGFSLLTAGLLGGGGCRGLQVVEEVPIICRGKAVKLRSMSRHVVAL